MERSTEFMQLLTGSQSRLYGYIMSLVLDPDDADDILQQTNAILWEKEADFELGTNFIAWSFRIAYYQVCSHRKRSQRNRLAFDSGLLEDLAAISLAADEHYEMRQRVVRRCLEKLGQRQRELVRQRYTAGSSIKSIAGRAGMTANSVKQMLYRARVALNACVEKTIKEDSLT